MNNSISIDVQTVFSGYDGKTCWVNPMVESIPDSSGLTIMVGQKLLLSHTDRFYGLNIAKSRDGGKNWSEFQPIPPIENTPTPSGERSVAGMTLNYLPATGQVMSIGCDVAYTHNHEIDNEYQRSIIYTFYDSATNKWNNLKKLQLPAEFSKYNTAVCNSQLVILDNGDIAIPVMIRINNSTDPFAGRYGVSVLRCRLENGELNCYGHGTILCIDVDRGLFEPSLTRHNGCYFLTLRNDQSGYVSCGNTPFEFDIPKKWTFDDGEWLGNYNTQQHWLTLDGNLYLVYTRKGLSNDHVFRHRAPLLISKIDPETLTVIRDTEQVVIPEHGARIGNFGVTRISDCESWVTVAEWMQPAGCERYGSNNRVFLARITKQ